MLEFINVIYNQQHLSTTTDVNIVLADKWNHWTGKMNGELPKAEATQ